MKIEATLSQPGTVSISIDTNKVFECITENDKSLSLHGKRVQGGIAIGPYDFIDGKTGYIVVAPSNQRRDSESVMWGGSGEISGLATIYDSSGIDPNTGIHNTDYLCTKPINYPAAVYCKNLSFEGCNDYFLPNKNELEYIYNQRIIINTVDTTGDLGMDGIWYWSSSEYNDNYAWHILFSDGKHYCSLKGSNRAVIPIRRILV